MFYLTLIFIFLVIVAIAIMLMPFRLVIDSVSGTYRLNLGHLASGELVIEGAQPYFDVKVLFWKKRFNPFEMKSGEKNEKKKENKVDKESRRDKKRKPVPFRKVLAVLKSFKVNRFRIWINTGDMPLNGIMYPLVYWMAYRTKKDIGIVFYGESIVRIDIENNLARIAWAFIKTK